MSANSNAIGIPVGELETPALCLDLEIYRRNAARMAAFITRDHGLQWRPHMKGQKAPELAREAITAGAMGVTCATLYEAEAMASAGIPNILIANQIAGIRKQARLAALARDGGILTIVDSEEHAAQLSSAAVAAGVVIPLLIEVDAGMNRCGVEPGVAVAALAAAITRMPGLRFDGVMAWEGHTLAFEGAEKQTQIAAAIRKLTTSADACRAAGIPVPVVSASGSGTFLLSAGLPGLTELQAGGGVFSDLNYERWGLDHEFALTVLTRVVSRPTTRRIVVDGGFKTMSVQHGQPRPIIAGAIEKMWLSAEHGIIELESPSPDPRVGDAISFIPGYTDSTVCLHDELCVVRNGVLEAVWTIPGRTGRR
jgi:D-serine deaminase-like pyridoxal phosphate-dependent protein